MSGKIAIVGSGPSGCYTAQALLKTHPGLQVDVIDALPVPYGLIRYGVAADHQGTKAISRQFARVFTRQGARFFGNVRIGLDLSLDDLRGAYDAVVLAAGLSGDRRLGVPGDDLPGVYGSAGLTRALYEHPDAGLLPDLGDCPILVGNGNVALDLLRLLAKGTDGLDGSDLGQGPTAWLAGNRFDRITVIGRSPAAAAKFDPLMLRELADLPGVSIRTAGPLGNATDSGAKVLLEISNAVDRTHGPLLIEFRFGCTPLRISDADGALVVEVATSEGVDTLSGSSIVTAIGFASDGDLGRHDLLGDMSDPERPEPGLYTAGWFRRGPTGTIPQNRIEAQTLAGRILAELPTDPDKAGADILGGIAGVVTFADWERIDAAEIEAAPADRCRRKFTKHADFLRQIRHQEPTT